MHSVSFNSTRKGLSLIGRQATTPFVRLPLPAFSLSDCPWGTRSVVHIRHRSRSNYQSGSSDQQTRINFSALGGTLTALMSVGYFFTKKEKNSFFETGKAHFEQGIYEAANNNLIKALKSELGPEQKIEAMNMRCYCLNHLGEFREAETLGTETLKKIDELLDKEGAKNLKAEALVCLANSHQHLGQLHLSRHRLFETISLTDDPSIRIRAFIILGYSLANADDLTQPQNPVHAFRIFSDIIEDLESRPIRGKTQQELAHAYSGKGHSLIALGRSREAIVAYQTAIKYAPPHIAHVKDRAQARIKLLQIVNQRKAAARKAPHPTELGVVTHSLLARFSQLAYLSVDEIDKHCPKGWEQIKEVKPDPTKSGYDGVAFQDLKGQVIVIAHRGTETSTHAIRSRL